MEFNPVRSQIFVSNRLLVNYLAWVFGPSWLLQLGAVFAEGGVNGEAAEGWLVITMFVPALVTTVFLIRHRPLREHLLWKPSLNTVWLVLLAVLVPTLIAFAVLAVIVAAGYGQPGWFAFSAAGVTVSGGPWLLGQGPQSWLLFVANVGLTGLAFALFNAIPAAGEEFAWRGFLQNWLTSRFGFIGGIAPLGVLWAFWHLPAQLVGYNFPDHPILGSLLISPLELVAVSLFLGWLTVKSCSFIPAAVAHGAGNSIQEGVVANLSLQVPRLYEDLITLGVTMAVGVLFYLLLRKL